MDDLVKEFAMLTISKCGNKTIARNDISDLIDQFEALSLDSSVKEKLVEMMKQKIQNLQKPLSQ